MGIKKKKGNREKKMMPQVIFDYTFVYTSFVTM